MYDRLVSEFRNLYDMEPPSAACFLHIWKLCCVHAIVKKTSQLSRFSSGEKPDAALKAPLDGVRETTALKAWKRAHLPNVMSDRLQYQKRQNNAILYPDRYFSTIIDGVDQSTFAIFYIVTKTTYIKGKAMKFRLIKVLEHHKANILHLFTMGGEHETGANHVVETLHRFVTHLASCRCLPHTCFV